MISATLLHQLETLTRVEKLHVVQLLVAQLAREEELLTAKEYAVWSPYDAPGAAAILTAMLEEDQQPNE